MAATPRVSSPPMATSASMPLGLEGRLAALHAAVDLERVGARRAEDRAAPGQRAPHGLDVERPGAALDHALPAVEEPDDLVALGVVALADDRPHDRVSPGQSPPPVSIPTRIGVTVCQAGVVGVSRTTTL